MRTSIHALDDDEARARWRALWEVSPQRSPFSALAYVDALAETLPLSCEMHLVTDGDRDEAGALVLWRRRGPYRVTVLPAFTQYAPLVMRRNPAEADVHRSRSALDALLEALENRFHVLRFLCPQMPDVRAAQWHAWTTRPLYTYVIDLMRADGLRSSWSSSTRRAFRKHRDAYTIAEASENLTAVVDLCERSYRRHGRSLPMAPETLSRLAGRLAASGMVRAFTATHVGDETVEGGALLLHDGRTAHYWVAGSERGPAMTVLLGTVLERLRTDGLHRFDFVGANTPSIAEFKRQFGPMLTPYVFLERITRPELRLLHHLRSTAR